MYVPALPLKRGEVRGLEDVHEPWAAQIAPLWTAPVPKLGEREGGLGGYVAKKARLLPKTFMQRLCWVDTAHVEADPDVLEERFWPEFQLFTAVVPVTGIERPRGAQELAARTGRGYGTGLGVRLRVTNTGLEVGAVEALLGLLQRCGLPAEEVDVLLDLEDIAETEQPVQAGVQAAREVCGVRPWRRRVLLAGAFPASLAPLRPKQMTRVPRVEPLVWQRVCEQTQSEGPLVYGDYSVVHPSKAAQVTDGPRKILGRVLYTAPEAYVIAKGVSQQDYGVEHVRELAELVEADDAFRGAGFSAGERHIAACVGGHKLGGVEQWIRAGHTQHLTYVVRRQL